MLQNENSHVIVLKHSEVREVQLALLFQLDNVLIPYYEQKALHWDYHPTQEIKKQIETLQKVMVKLNAEAGNYSEME